MVGRTSLECYRSLNQAQIYYKLGIFFNGVGVLLKGNERRQSYSGVYQMTSLEPDMTQI